MFFYNTIFLKKFLLKHLIMQTPNLSKEVCNTKVAKLQYLANKVKSCQNCKLFLMRKNAVFGIGNPDAQLLFVGEAPGFDEDIQQKPFVGRAGKLLTKMINAMGLLRSKVYICNVVNCKPPDNRKPARDEIEICNPFLVAQIEIIKPKIIVALGAYALNTLLISNFSITHFRGTWMRYKNIDVMPTFHPAYLLRYPIKKKDTWFDLQQVMKRLKNLN